MLCDGVEVSFSSSIGSDDLAEVDRAELNWNSKNMDCAEVSFSSSIGSDDLAEEVDRAMMNWNSTNMDRADISFPSSIGSDDLAEVTRAESNMGSKEMKNEEQMSIESDHENEFLVSRVPKDYMETIRKIVLEDGKVSKILSSYLIYLLNFSY